MRDAFELCELVARPTLRMGRWGKQRHQVLAEHQRQMTIQSVGHGLSMRGVHVGYEPTERIRMGHLNPSGYEPFDQAMKNLARFIASRLSRIRME